jgi:hypothetical protein
MKENKLLKLKIVNTVTFITMVVVNALAAALPINGMDPGQISDSYPNLFAPTGFTFSIWGVIYIMLALFVIYQWGAFKGKSEVNLDEVKKIGWLFAISSLINTAWIFSWHYQIIPLSWILMLGILISLIIINNRLSESKMSGAEKLFVRLPFSIYFGWITVATIANTVTMLVSFGWNGFGVSESIWMIIALVAGVVIGVSRMLKNKDIAYGLVIVWAYFGILMKHIGTGGYSVMYPAVIIAVVVAMLLLVMSLVVLIVKARSAAE